MVVQAKQNCLLCGSVGKLLYKDLEDRIFHIPGKWNFRRCPNSECGLVWLDPSVKKEEIWKTYRRYYTHRTNNAVIPGNRYVSILHRFYCTILRITPLSHQRFDMHHMFLDSVKPGRLFEVGCGDGRRLAHLRSLGWDVEGQEIDPVSTAYCRSAYGLTVHLGYLEELGVDESRFDALIMNHVIEHAYNPIELLKECRRILKPGGVLIVVTPNIGSVGHRYFKSFWRGLEPPRHLYLFSQRTLSRLAICSGFDRPKVWTTAANAQYIAEGSLSIKYHKSSKYHDVHPMVGVAAVFWQLWSSLIFLADRNSGEECVLRASK